MSDQFDDYYSRLGPLRRLTQVEYQIVAKLVHDTEHSEKILEQLRDAQVRDMPDGGMGSIQFCVPGSEAMAHRFGKQIAEGAFTDADGTPVSVTIDIDEQGNLNELDVFKSDGSRLIRFPEITDFKIIERHGQLGCPPQER
jgi:hypothetical protein